MATGANHYNKHYGSEQWATNTTTGSGSISYTYPHHKEEMKNARKLKPLPKIDFVEFGKSLVVPKAMATQDGAVQIAYESLLKDFFQIKAENFPTWFGLPDIKVNTEVHMLNQDLQISWYVKVPKNFVLDKDQKLEEDLWNS